MNDHAADLQDGHGKDEILNSIAHGDRYRITGPDTNMVVQGCCNCLHLLRKLAVGLSFFPMHKAVKIRIKIRRHGKQFGQRAWRIFEHPLAYPLDVDGLQRKFGTRGDHIVCSDCKRMVLHGSWIFLQA